MADNGALHGFKPVRYLSGKAYTGAAKRYKMEAATILAVGDPVVITGTSEAVTGIALVDRAAAGSGTITGVVVGIDVQRGDLSKNHLAAADSGYVMVADDPDLVFEVVADGAIAVTDVGEFADIIVANADTTTGMSQCAVDASNAGTGDQVRILGRAQREDNALTGTPTIEVMINEHTLRAVSTPI